MNKKPISKVNVNLKVRTSKIENKFFQNILKILENNSNSLESISTNGLLLKQLPLPLEECKVALDGLLNKGLSVVYFTDEKIHSLSFNYISSYYIFENEITIYLPQQIINSFKKTTIEHDISLRTFFYLRKKSLINFFNILIKNIHQNKNISLSLEELKDIFEISEDTYDRFFDFEKNILKPLVEKINAHSNFLIEYQKIKKGENKNNKVIALNFKIHNIEVEKNRGETNYLAQIIKNMITDYQAIWESINNSIQHYGFESTKRNILFLKENGLEISDSDIKNYLKNDGRNIEEILKLSDHILIKEKYGIYKDAVNFTKIIYDTIIGYDFYYSLNFNFLNVIKNYEENEKFFYKDSTFVIFGYYKNNKGFFKILEARGKK